VRKFTVIAAGAAGVLLTGSAQAWNGSGHMAVAAIAWEKLTPKAKQQAGDLLALNPYYLTWTQGIEASEKAHIAFVRAATWPDQIKGDKDYHNDGARNGDVAPSGPEASQNIGYEDHLRHKYWHFYDTSFTSDSSRIEQPQQPNAETEIAKMRAALANPSTSADIKSYDLAWLLHLIGDVHQPLHATTRFTDGKSDNGGNSVLGAHLLGL
jgi:hypothetical protein